MVFDLMTLDYYYVRLDTTVYPLSDESSYRLRRLALRFWICTIEMVLTVLYDYLDACFLMNRPRNYELIRLEYGFLNLYPSIRYSSSVNVMSFESIMQAT